jgi:hypothetical protein
MVDDLLFAGVMVANGAYSTMYSSLLESVRTGLRIVQKP